jgi:hypothetical protein
MLKAGTKSSDFFSVRISQHQTYRTTKHPRSNTKEKSLNIKNNMGFPYDKS